MKFTFGKKRALIQALEWAGKGGGGVTDPGGVQGTFRCFVEGQGLAGTIGDRWMAGLDDLGDLSKLWSFCDSLILFYTTSCVHSLECNTLQPLFSGELQHYYFPSFHLHVE